VWCIAFQIKSFVGSSARVRFSDRHILRRWVWPDQTRSPSYRYKGVRIIEASDEDPQTDVPQRPARQRVPAYILRGTLLVRLKIGERHDQPRAQVYPVQN